MPTRQITQRERRNESGRIMRALDRGHSFVVTRNGVPVGELVPLRLAVSAITMAELAAGPHATADGAERARRQNRLQRAEATFEPLPIDAAVARAYGRVYLTPITGGRKARGNRRGSPHRGNGRRGWTASVYEEPARFCRPLGDP
jgi:predicted nucleic acid-binding protein